MQPKPILAGFAMRVAVRIIALSLCWIIGLLAIAMTVRSLFTRDNASWVTFHTVPISQPSAYAGEFHLTQTQWIWLSSYGVLEIGHLRIESIRATADTSDFHYKEGFNSWRFDPAGWDQLAGRAIGMRFLGAGRFNPASQNPRMVLWDGKYVRVPLPFIALVALIWPSLRTLAWLRSHQRGFPVVQTEVRDQKYEVSQPSEAPKVRQEPEPGATPRAGGERSSKP